VAEIIRKTSLPHPSEVSAAVRTAAEEALSLTLRQPRPEGFPLLFTSKMELMEAAVGFLHEHAVLRACTPDTVRTYTEILLDWFDSLETHGIAWSDADVSDLVSYRDRMLKKASSHTRRAFSIRTVNHRVRGVLRFYAWAVRNGWLQESSLASSDPDVTALRHNWAGQGRRYLEPSERSMFVLRQFESLPRPLRSDQARELLAALPSPYDLMARWQLYTGLRVSELLRLEVCNVMPRGSQPEVAPYRSIDVARKGRKAGYVIAPRSLLEETDGYISQERRGWSRRAARKRRRPMRTELFISRRGLPVCKNTYQHVIRRASIACGFKATSHLLRATFGCWLLARLERLEKQGEAINPLLIVKILMGHEHIDTTDRYLRAIAIDVHVLSGVLDTLLGKERTREA